MIIDKNFRRVFLAVAAPAEMVTLIDELKKACSTHRALKWMRVHNLHLTIFFIGNIAKKDYNSVVEGCRNTVAKFAPFELIFDSVSTAPSANPRMLWARYKPHDQFTDLYHALNTCLKPHFQNSFEVYEQPVPHITLARFHGLKQPEILSVPLGCILPNIYIDKIFIWETESNNGQSDYIQNPEALYLT